MLYTGKQVAQSLRVSYVHVLELFLVEDLSQWPLQGARIIMENTKIVGQIPKLYHLMIMCVTNY